MATFSGHQITKKGHALNSRLLAGENKIHFSAVRIGDGQWEGDWDGPVLDICEMVNPRIDGRIISVSSTPNRQAELTCIIDNRDLTEFMFFREIGIFAIDPQDGEILFSYAQAGEFPHPIGPFDSGFMSSLHEEIFTIRTLTSNIKKITADITPTTFASEITYKNEQTKLESQNVQDAIDETITIVEQGFDNVEKTIDNHNCDPAAHEDIFSEIKNNFTTNHIALSKNPIPNQNTRLHKQALIPFVGFLPNAQWVGQTPPVFNAEHEFDGTQTWNGRPVQPCFEQKLVEAAHEMGIVIVA